MQKFVEQKFKSASPNEKDKLKIWKYEKWTRGKRGGKEEEEHNS